MTANRCDPSGVKGESGTAVPGMSLRATPGCLLASLRVDLLSFLSPAAQATDGKGQRSQA
jgi:hypothetical protein